MVFDFLQFYMHRTSKSAIKLSSKAAMCVFMEQAYIANQIPWQPYFANLEVISFFMFMINVVILFFVTQKR
jgi:hypothetical protein